MGTIFGFISSDVQEKMQILYQLLGEPNESKCFSTVKGMIEYEKNNGLLDKANHVSGSRTLLRLHRGLGHYHYYFLYLNVKIYIFADFIRVFLKKISELQDDENTSGACREAYDLTLAEHHSFLIRNGARIAIYTLPTKKNLLTRVRFNK